MEKPGAYPTPDDQGLGNTCSIFAVSKAVAAKLHEGIWPIGKVDVDQQSITSALLQVFQDTKPRWPSEFDGETILIMDRYSRRYLQIRLKITPQPHQVCNSTEKQVLVYEYKHNGQSLGPHCVFSEKFDKGIFKCINSHGSIDMFPQLDKNEILNIFNVDVELSTTFGKNTQRNDKSFCSKISDCLAFMIGIGN